MLKFNMHMSVCMVNKSSTNNSNHLGLSTSRCEFLQDFFIAEQYIKAKNSHKSHVANVFYVQGNAL